MSSLALATDDTDQPNLPLQTYAAPVIGGDDGALAGIFALDLDASGLLGRDLKTAEGVVAFLTSQDGVYLSHPPIGCPKR